MTESSMDDKTRAAIWYAENGDITDSVLGGIKAVRECAHIRLERCQVESQEFGWKSQDITLIDTDIVSEYLFMDSRDVKLRGVKIRGKCCLTGFTGISHVSNFWMMSYAGCGKAAHDNRIPL